MRRRPFPFLLLTAAVAGGLGYWIAARHRPPDVLEPVAGGTVRVPRPVVKGNSVVLAEEPRKLPRHGEPLKEALNALLETATDSPTSAIPRGTRLLSVNLADGEATIDLSREFRAIDERGDTGESLAQNALCKTVAQFPRVRTMRVLVEGKPYEGEHSGEWTDIPVRDGAPGEGGGQ